MTEVAKLLQSARRLHFDGGVEQAFRADYAASTQRMIRASFVLATIIYGAFGVLDLYCLPKTRGVAVALRVGAVCPVLAGVAGVTFSPRLYRFIQPIMALAAVISGAAIVWIIGASRPDEPGFTHYYVGLILVMMFVSSFIRLRFWAALVANVAILTTYEFMAVTRQALLQSAAGRLSLVTNNFFLAGAFAIGASTCYWLEVAARREFVQRLALEAEKAKTDKLLLNTLPEIIVGRMKRSADPIADELRDVSVLFADLVNFTTLAARVSPQELVGMLNEVFSGFDNFVEKYGLEKIKTIGDCYMVASGVPTPRADHAIALTSLAIELRDWMRRPEVNRGLLEIRIGISSGPVVAGVIGKRKFIYDLWGDTVNTASRMESHGVPGTIQITKATRDLLNNHFELEYGGTKVVKGKGDTEVWYVTGRREQAAVLP